MTEEYDNIPKVIKIIDDYSLVINRGSEHDIRVHSKFLIFGAGEQLVDPDTGEALGMLELVRGKARVIHVQANMSTLTSDDFDVTPGTKRTIKRQGAAMLMLDRTSVGSVKRVTSRVDLDGRSNNNKT